MRLAAGLAVLATLAAALHTPALAQVTVNPGALDILPQAGSTPPPRPAPRPVRPSAPGRTPPRTPARPPPPPAPPPAAPPVIPQAAPPIASLPPPIVVPVPRPAAPPVVPVTPDAVGAAEPIPGGVRVTFGAGSADLNPVTEAALRQFARGVKANDALTASVYAFAAGPPDDPSTPRRVSLSRALAARAVLISEGIASTRIYVHAQGPAAGDDPPERVDVTQVAPR